MLSNLMANWMYILLVSLVLSGAIVGISANHLRLRAHRHVLAEYARRPPTLLTGNVDHGETFYANLEEYEAARKAVVESIDHYSYLLLHTDNSSVFEDATNELHSSIDEIMTYGNIVCGLRESLPRSEEHTAW